MARGAVVPPGGGVTIKLGAIRSATRDYERRAKPRAPDASPRSRKG